MATLKFKNNASTTLSGSINDSQTSITVANSSNFPVISGGDYFFATLYEVSTGVEINLEIVKVTATSGNNWTIVRGQDGTTARSRDGISTCYVENRLTAASADLMLQKDNNLSDLQSASTARTNLGLGGMATQSPSAVAITGGSISGVTFDGIDSASTFSDNADNTKKLQLQLNGIATGATRTLTAPDADGTIALTSDLTAGYQPLDSDLTAVASLTATGLVARTATGVMEARTLTQPAAGFTITNAAGIGGDPTFVLADDLAAVESISTTGFVRRTAANTWTAASIANGDLPGALTGKTYDGLSLSALTTGFSVAGGSTNSKTLTVSNSITLQGTDSTTITLPATSGAVPLNNQTFYIGTTQVAINRSSASLSLSGVDIDGSAGSATTATTATKATNLVGGNGNTLLGSIGYQSGTDTTTLLAPNTTATKQFLSQTGTGTNGAAPAWSAVSKSDVGLGSVENTALSTWAGSTNITTVGPLTSGSLGTGFTAVAIAQGGTGQSTKAAGFNALSPVTTLGDLIYGDGANSNARLPGSIVNGKRFLTQTGNGTISAVPSWGALVDGDIPSALTGKTYNGLTVTSSTGTLTVTNAKTLSVSNTLTLTATDGSTLAIGTGGTLGSAAYTASTAYAPAAGSSNIVTVGALTSGSLGIGFTAVAIAQGGTGQTTKSGAYNALTPITTLGDIVYGDGTNSATRLAGNTVNGKRFLTQTGNGTISAAPGWNAIADGDIPSALTGKTYNGLSLTANATGFQVAGGTTSKTLVVSNNITLSGNDGSTLTIGAGGTLGSLAFLSSINNSNWSGTQLTVANGGTNLTSYTAGDMLYATGTTTLTKLPKGTAGQALTMNSGATAPAWATLTLENLPDAWVKKAVKAATTADLAAASNTATTITGTLVVFPAQDGITLALNDRLLVKNQTSSQQNGIYTLTTVGVAATTAWVLTRAADADTSAEIAGAAVAVDQGTANGGKTFDTDFKSTDTLGTTAMAWYAYVDTSYTIPISQGGTGQTTATAGFNALSPVTTLGDIIFRGASNNERLAGNITSTKQFLTSTGNGSLAAAPAWAALANGDIPTALTGKTYNGLTVTSSTGTLTIAAAKTLTVSNTLTLAGTDSSTLNIGTGGTLGTGAYATIANYAPLASPTFTGTIRANFDNATALPSRVYFQGSVTNGTTDLTAVPNGTGNRSGFGAINSSDTTNHGFVSLLALSTDMRLWSGKNGTGSVLPLTFYTDATKRAEFGAAGGFDVATGLRETKVTMGANAIDVRAGNYFTKTISGATTLTVSNVPSTGTAASFILDLTNGGSALITWWSGVKWAGGTAPTLTTSGRDVLGFFTHDGGTIWTGLLLAKDVK